MTRSVSAKNDAEAGVWTSGVLLHSPQADHDFSLVIPAYNEEGRLPWTLAELRRFLDAWGIDYRVLVADDGSTDRTAALAAGMGPRFSTVSLPQNRGKGAAVRNAMLRASGEVLAFTDADLPFELESLRQAYDLVRKARCEVVFGARDLAQSSHRAKRKLSRTLATWLFREVVKRLGLTRSYRYPVRLEGLWPAGGTRDLLPLDAGRLFVRCGSGLPYTAAGTEVPAHSRQPRAGVRFDAFLAAAYHSHAPRHRGIVVAQPSPARAGAAIADHTRKRVPGTGRRTRSPQGSLTTMGGALRTAIMTGPEFAAHPEGAPPSPAHPSSARRIALHADDLGMNPAVTEGILQGFEQGLLTSTSLLSNAPDAARALDRWRQLESSRRQRNLASMARRERLQDPAQPFDLGVHLNLTQGHPLTGSRYPAALLDASGRFPGIFGLFRRLRGHHVPMVGRESAAMAIEEELTCQVQFMLDRGHRPTHLNGHQYIEMLPVVGGVVESLLKEFRIPVVRVAWEPSWRQSFTWPGISTSQWLIGGLKKVHAGRFRRQMLGKQVFFADAFFGTMTAGTTSLDTLSTFLAAVRDFRLAEIGLHPSARPNAAGQAADGWHDPLADLRPRELEMVLSVELEELLAAHGCRLGRLGREQA